MHAHLKDGLRDNLGKRSSIDGLCREEAPEVLVCMLCSNLELALEPRHPALHEMYIVEEDPATFLDVLVQACFSRLLLSLTHGDQGQVAFLDRVVHLIGIHLQAEDRSAVSSECRSTNKQVNTPQTAMAAPLWQSGRGDTHLNLLGGGVAREEDKEDGRL